MRTFEFLLHLGYKLEIKVHFVRGEVDEAIVARRKKDIQEQFYEKLSLTVDKPKQGFGNSNDGNTARRLLSIQKLFQRSLVLMLK